MPGKKADGSDDNKMLGIFDDQLAFDRVIVKNSKCIYHLSYAHRAIFRIPFDLSMPPQKIFDSGQLLANKMLNMYASDDDHYLFVVYADEEECILLTIDSDSKTKEKKGNVLSKFQLGPGVKKCGFLCKKD